MSNADQPSDSLRPRTTGLPPAVGPEPKINEELLDKKLSELEKVRAWSPRLVSRLEALLRHPDDFLVFRINPLNFAAERGVSEQEAIDLFLHATKGGIFNMFWHLVCPGCGDAVDSLQHITALHNQSRCGLCMSTFEVDFDNFIQVTFTVAPTIRDIIWNHPDDLSSEDYFFRYRFAGQGRLPDGTLFMERARKGALWVGRIQTQQTETFTCDVALGAVAVFNMSVGGRELVMVEGEPTQSPQTLEVRVADSITLQPSTLAPGPVTVTLFNQTHGLLSSLMSRIPQEAVNAGSTILTFGALFSGRRLLSSQTFRDLFRSEVIQGTEGINVKDSCILFTDLKGSTAMYERIGDLNAFSLVSQHFDRLGKVIYEHEGAVVKTIGDAIMASFNTAAGAVKAAMKMLLEIDAFNRERGSRDIILKVGVHRGASIAVNLNDRLDYFGQTVNIAARIQGLADADEVYISPVVKDSPGVAEALVGCTVQARRVMLKGVHGEMTVFRVRLPELAAAAGEARNAEILAAVNEAKAELGTGQLGVAPASPSKRPARWTWPASVAAAALVGLAVGWVAAPQGHAGGTVAVAEPELLGEPALVGGAEPDSAAPAGTEAVAAAARPQAAAPDDEHPEAAELDAAKDEETKAAAPSAPAKELTPDERKAARRELLAAAGAKKWDAAILAGERLAGGGRELDWEALFALSSAYQAAGRTAQARAGFEQFLAKVKPRNKLVDDAKYHLGEILSAQGEKAAAQANFKAVAADAKSNLRKEAQGRLGHH